MVCLLASAMLVLGTDSDPAPSSPTSPQLLQELREIKEIMAANQGTIEGLRNELSEFKQNLSDLSRRCPEQFFPNHHLGSCYFIGKSRLSWYQAQYACAAHARGAYLVEVESAYEDHFLEGIQEYTIKEVGFWMGGRKVAADKEWMWHTSGHPVVYRNWFKNGPNRDAPGCLIYWTQYRWSKAIACRRPQKYICEVDI